MARNAYKMKEEKVCKRSLDWKCIQKGSRKSMQKTAWLGMHTKRKKKKYARGRMAGNAYKMKEEKVCKGSNGRECIQNGRRKSM